MKIKIYQINMERDDEGCAFMGMDFLNRKLGVDHPASEIYEQVFDGEIDGKSPEDVFAKDGVHEKEKSSHRVLFG